MIRIIVVSLRRILNNYFKKTLFKITIIIAKDKKSIVNSNFLYEIFKFFKKNNYRVSRFNEFIY